MSDTGRMTAIRVNEAHIARLEAELDRLKHGQKTSTRLVGIGERVLTKLIVGAILVLAMRYGLITNEELQAAKEEIVIAEEGRDQALLSVGENIEAALESCEVGE